MTGRMGHPSLFQNKKPQALIREVLGFGGAAFAAAEQIDGGA